jgi:hypothetical protein
MAVPDTLHGVLGCVDGDPIFQCGLIVSTSRHPLPVLPLLSSLASSIHVHTAEGGPKTPSKTRTGASPSSVMPICWLPMRQPSGVVIVTAVQTAMASWAVRLSRSTALFATAGQSNPTKTSAFAIGESPVFTSRFFHGGIALVALSDRGLSAGDVASIYQAAGR